MKNSYCRVHKSISNICISVTLWATIAIVLVTLLAGAITFIQNIEQIHDEEQKKLNIITPVIMNSLAGELIIGDDRAVRAILSEFKDKYNLSDISVNHSPIGCPKYNILNNDYYSCVDVQIPDIYPKSYLRIVSTGTKLTKHTIEVFIMWTFLPLTLLGFIISHIINNKLKKSIVDPIISLANNPEAWTVKSCEVAQEVIIVSDKLRNYINERNAQIKDSENLKIEASLGKFISQLVHDIRSPLAALNIAFKQMSNMPEDERIIIRGAVNRIQDIANNLLNIYNTSAGTKDSQNSITPELITDLVLNVVSEKRIQYQDTNLNLQTNINTESYGSFVNLNNSDFKRVISNLINNSIESLRSPTNGEITVSLIDLNNSVNIQIKDNGSGISPEILPKILSGEFKSSKEKGSGLGLSYAIRNIKAWGGDIQISSKVDQGTLVNLKFKKVNPPTWFASRIEIATNTTVVIVDDDEFIHQAWLNHFKSYNNFNFISFNRTYEFINWYNANSNKIPMLFLIDYELLGSDMTGLDIICQLNISPHTYLVTSRYEEEVIRLRSEKMGIKIIPKSFANHIPVIVNNMHEFNVDLILIDDSEPLTKSWMMHFKKLGKVILTYNSIGDFNNHIKFFNKSTPIYIDNDLNDCIAGHEFAKELYALGYTELYLATGCHKDEFDNMPWLKGVVGKEPPF